EAKQYGRQSIVDRQVSSRNVQATLQSQQILHLFIGCHWLCQCLHEGATIEWHKRLVRFVRQCLPTDDVTTATQLRMIHYASGRTGTGKASGARRTSGTAQVVR